MNITEQMVAHYAGVGYGDLDKETVRRVKIRLLDTVGVMLAGTKGVGCKNVCDFLAEKGGRPEATVMGFGRKLPADSTAFVNSLMARSFDFDAAMAMTDKGGVKPAHISATTVPAALAAAERNAASGRDVVCALAVGDDLASRTVAYSGGGPHDVFDNTGTMTGMGAVVACAKLYGLDEAQFKHAMGIMVSSISGSMSESDEQTMSFKYPMANAARSAVQAAELALCGFESASDPLCGPKCFFDTFGADYNLDGFLDTFGKAYLGDAVIKPWSSCRMTHAGIDATVRATGGKALNPDDIESFTITMHPKMPPFITAPWSFGDTFQPHGAFSLRYTAAIAALYGAVRPELFAEDIMASPNLKAMLDLQSFETDPTLESNEIARACIVLKDGTKLEGQVEKTPRGDFLRSPLGEDEVVDKFMKNVAFSGLVPRGNAERAVELLLDIENQETLDEVISLLRAV